MQKDLNKTFEEKPAESPEQSDQESLQNDTASVSIQILCNDCLIRIFQFLSILDRVRMNKICKRWNKIISQSGPWSKMKELDLSSIMWGTVDLTFNSEISRLMLHGILQKCGKFLTRINLIENQDYFINRNALTLNDIIEFCPNLKYIEVNAIDINESDIEKLASYRNLIKLNLGQLNYTSDKELQALVKANRNLKHLEFSQANLGKCLLRLPAQSIDTIILKDCFIQNDCLIKALKRLKNLQHFTLEDCSNVPDHTLNVVGAHCKNLTILQLTCRLYGLRHTVNNLICLVNLQVLKIHDNQEISDRFLADLVQHCEQLICLDITGCSVVTDTGVAAIATLPKLDELNISCLYQITGDGLPDMYDLKKLTSRECILITDRTMSMFIKSTLQLQLLDISRCDNITNVTLRAAINACNSRKLFNNLTLTMIINNTRITEFEMTEEILSPLLQIVHTT